MNKNKKNSKEQGLSLVELMVSLVVSMFIMIGIYQIYLSATTSNRLLQTESELQENARFVFSTMTSIIQEAGNFGCRTSTDVTTHSLLDTTDVTFKPWGIIEGWEAKDTDYDKPYKAAIDTNVIDVPSAHWSSSTGTVLDQGIKAKEHSDILKVWYTKKQRTNLISLNAGVLTFSAIDLELGDVVIINDCKTVNFAQVCRCDDTDSEACEGNDQQADISVGACNTPGNIAHNFSLLNLPTTEVNVLETAIFYVGKRDNDSNNIPTLFMRNLGSELKPSAAEELVEGVESMQIQYGEDTNNDKSPNYYVSANNVSDWNNIVALKISLLLRSKKNNLIYDKQLLSFNGKRVETQTADRHLRHVYTFTVALRNRNIGY